jgi:hypothetical protein
MTTKATEISEEGCVEEVLVSDEEHYYVEEIMDDEEEQWDAGDLEEELEEETAVEQSYVEEDDDDDDDDGDEEEDYCSEESYFDDSSSAPSFCPENPLFENEMDSGMNLHESLSSIDLIREHNLERQRAAVYEGERKAMEEAVARDAYVKRQAAREALQRRRLEQEALASHGDENGYNEAERIPPDQPADSAVRILLERIHRTEQILLQENGSVPPRIRVLGAAEQEQRKRALAELRRQTARNQLMDNNSRLKECKAQEFGDSASSVLS